jgi:hypothetical protein
MRFMRNGHFSITRTIYREVSVSGKGHDRLLGLSDNAAVRTRVSSRIQPLQRVPPLALVPV